MTTAQPNEGAKGRRVSIDLTPSAASEVDRLRSITELSTADVFRHALHLFRMYVDERGKGRSLFFGNTDNPRETATRVELAITVQQAAR